MKRTQVVTIPSDDLFPSADVTLHTGVPQGALKALEESSFITIFLVLHSQYDLWGPVVSGHHVGGHHEVSAGRPSQTKIQDL